MTPFARKGLRMTLVKLLPLAALALSATLAAPAQAATLLGSFQHDYGSDAGRIDPPGTDALNAASVTVSDQSSGRFSDSFDFSSLAYDSIESFSLTLTYAGAGPSFSLACLGICELWTVRVQGNNSSGFDDDLFGLLTGTPVQTFNLSASDDVGSITAFAQSVASQTYAFWFSEWSGGADSFRLSSARLDIYGTPPIAAVPLPAGGLLLMGGLGAFAALRRRTAA
jgi:hypothetical protein